MKFAFKSLVLAAAIASTGMANALTVDTTGPVTDQGWEFSGLTGTGTLSFSTTLIGALNAGGVVVSQVDPAIVESTRRPNGKYQSVSAAAPVSSLTGDFDGTTVSVTEVATLGGALQTAEPDDFTTTGGSLAITNLRVDLTNKRVYADLDGANGVGVVNDLYLWDIATVTGATSFAVQNGVNTSVNELTGLTIRAEAFELFATALGLTDAGRQALSTVTDFGRISSTISVTAAPAVPEPSTYAMMGVGLVVAGAAAMRRRAAK